MHQFDPVLRRRAPIHLPYSAPYISISSIKNHQQTLNKTDRSILFVAALMHDIAKPKCTEVIDGKISSPRHAMVGAKMTRSLIFRNKLGNIPFEIREKIVDLVRYHGLPLWFLEKENPEKS
mgnify:CR=1 FL=1